MEVVSFIITCCGFLLSLYALQTAKDVKSAVDGTIRKVNIQRDISEISDILNALHKAKSAASIWVPGAVVKSQVGRDILVDLRLVRDAQDALAVWVPADMGKLSTSRLQIELTNLRDYCDKISAPKNNENHWNGVVTSAQSLIRLLRGHVRTLENSQLILEN